VSLDPITPAPVLVEQTYEKLMQAITQGLLLPGERIRQADLASQMGVSRQPVSHALQLLKQQGLVQDSGRKGLEVAPIEPDRIRDLYQVRAALDALAARLTAERVRCGRIEDKALLAIRQAAEAGFALEDRGDIAGLVAADIAFHKRIYIASGNPAILDILNPQLPHMLRSMGVVLDAAIFRERVWHEHAAIARLILAGETEAAAEAARLHAEAAGQETEKRLREQAEKRISRR
jgi:DNA-binding GntR family transcriptional regulator